MPSRLLELCPADCAKSPPSFALQDKVVLTYHCLGSAEVKSRIRRALTLDRAFSFLGAGT